jgi:hypothetical protein
LLHVNSRDEYLLYYTLYSSSKNMKKCTLTN